MESTKKRPHQALSLEKKLQILQDLDRSGLSKTEVAKKFNIPKSTLSRILKNKEAIEGAVKNGTFTSRRMRMRTTPIPKPATDSNLPKACVEQSKSQGSYSSTSCIATGCPCYSLKIACISGAHSVGTLR
ncbi:hypothetical protein HPB50_017364 [Hyalomma asiaticum]|uniref:Uncharacterized protein n=1 Tax=Hyalomma asiaticum TaxID=266040 RepID=A0ACB7RLF7_HYAAI|nr:hypothetical protein HPB50_017364 [Hyalomma asiaticum]